VIGNAEIAIAPVARGLCHRFERIDAIGPVGMGVQYATYVGIGDNCRKLAFLGERDLAPPLAKLRLNELKPKRTVDLFFALARYLFCEAW